MKLEKVALGLVMDDNFERTKWACEVQFRKRELDLEERKIAAVEANNSSSQWKNPLVLAIFAAAIAAVGNAGVAFINGRAQRHLEEANNTGQLALEQFKADALNALEETKAEAARILEVIKTGDPDSAAVNLDFLLQSGLISNKDRRSALTNFLNNRRPGEGPALLATPQSALPASELITKFEGFTPTIEYTGGVPYIGYGHALTDEELSSKRLKIDGDIIEIENGITEEQALRLLNVDNKKFEETIEKIVTVPLSKDQLSVLTSLARNVGMNSLRESQLVYLLNLGRYEDVANEIRSWPNRSGLPGIQRRREIEASAWERTLE